MPRVSRILVSLLSLAVRVSAIEFDFGNKRFVYDYENSVLGKEARYDEARDWCNRMGGTLPSVHSREELDFLINHAKVSAFNYLTYVWLGARIDPSIRDWVWDDGSSWNYSAFDEGDRCITNASLAAADEYLLHGFRFSATSRSSMICSQGRNASFIKVCQKPVVASTPPVGEDNSALAREVYRLLEELERNATATPESSMQQVPTTTATTGPPSSSSDVTPETLPPQADQPVTAPVAGAVYVTTTRAPEQESERPFEETCVAEGRCVLVDPDYPVKVEGDASDQQEQASGAGEPLTLQSLSQLLDQRISSLASDVREAVAEREERVMQELHRLHDESRREIRLLASSLERLGVSQERESAFNRSAVQLIEGMQHVFRVFSNDTSRLPP